MCLGMERGERACAHTSRPVPALGCGVTGMKMLVIAEGPCLSVEGTCEVLKSSQSQEARSLLSDATPSAL